jgi:type I restriction enzyme R subunit
MITLPGSTTLRTRLAALPTAHPLEAFMAGAAQPLRDCQVEAITGLEASLAAARPRSLIHMATGAGKTFTAVTEVYRLLKFARLKRVLFLVDRNSLGTQAKGEFDTYAAPDTGKLFPEVYNVCHLGAAGFDPVNQVVISTIQRLFAQLKGDPEAIDDDEDERSSFDSDLATGEPIEVSYQPNLPPETFDLIIVDECHRSIYNKWKQVLDYFDAFIVGLTATPSLDTEAFFHQNTVSRYTYRQSVLDEVNVDYIAYRIATRIGTEGSSLPSGSQLELFDSYRNVQETHAIEDDLEYGANELGRSVIADDQIRTVLETYRDHLHDTFFPGRSGQWVPKTLIFAKTDAHADRVIRICRDVFDKGDAFCRKITHKATSSAVKAKDLIQHFRTQAEFRIAVTVDMVATGVDIKPLECLIFLRDVRSPLLYDQMKGRGCRSIKPTDLANVTPDAPDNRKTHFVLLDAVGVEESEKLAVSPADRRQTVTLKELIEGIRTGERSEPDDFTSLAGRLARLAERARPADIAPIEQTLGQSLTDWARQIADLGQNPAPADPNDSADTGDNILAPLASDTLRQQILNLRGYSPILIDILSQDELTAAPEAITPRETITNFEQFLAENRDRLTALQIIYNNRPGSGLTYDTIAELRESLRQPPYHLAPDAVWRAYEALENTRSTATPVKVLTNLITLVRHTVDPETQPLAPFPELVEQRYQHWLDQQADRFTDAQRHWLDVIKNYVALNGAFATENNDAYLDAWQSVDSDEGVPLAVATRVFGKENLKPVIEELNEVLVA